MPFIGRGGSSPPPDTVTRAKAPDSRAFARRVRPLKADRAPLVGFWPDTSPVAWSTGMTGSAVVLPLEPRPDAVARAAIRSLGSAWDGVVAAVAALPPDASVLLWAAGGRVRVLWSAGGAE